MKPLWITAFIPFLAAVPWIAPRTSRAEPSPEPTPFVSPLPQAGWTCGALGGVDKVFTPSGNNSPANQIDLSQEGAGVHYDPDRWVVFVDYQSLVIQAGAHVGFHNHPSRAPVVIRVAGDVTIDGSLWLDGARGHNWNEGQYYSEPGPGGARGGVGVVYGPDQVIPGSAGFGIGGAFLPANGQFWGGHASHVSIGGSNPSSNGVVGDAYDYRVPTNLLGGSGGSGGLNQGYRGAGGGAGGGALLLGSNTMISIGANANIYARGGRRGSGDYYNDGGDGSGGTILLFAPVCGGDGGQLRAEGGNYGGSGRIEIHTNSAVSPTLLYYSFPPPQVRTLDEFPTQVPVASSLRLVKFRATTDATWTDIQVADPRARLSPASDADVSIPNAVVSYIVRVEGRNVPRESPMVLYLVRSLGQRYRYSALCGHTLIGDVTSTDGLSYTDFQIADFGQGVSTVQVRAEY